MNTAHQPLYDDMRPVIKALIALRATHAKVLAPKMGMHPSKLSARVNGHIPWRLHELHLLADALNVDITMFNVSPEEAVRRLSDSGWWPTTVEYEGQMELAFDPQAQLAVIG